jgi:hypothetical protein
VIEQKVDKEIPVSNGKALLASHKRKANTQFEQKLTQVCE